MNIETRRQMLINTDPQRRCYNGCHYKPELSWTPWEVLQVNVPESDIKARLAWWRSLNNYAVGERGESARCEFREQT